LPAELIHRIYGSRVLSHKKTCLMLRVLQELWRHYSLTQASRKHRPFMTFLCKLSPAPRIFSTELTNKFRPFAREKNSWVTDAIRPFRRPFTTFKIFRPSRLGLLQASASLILLHFSCFAPRHFQRVLL
jgi:hypothetical protein